MPGQILAMGGGSFIVDPKSPLDDFFLSLAYRVAAGGETPLDPRLL